MHKVKIALVSLKLAFFIQILIKLDKIFDLSQAEQTCHIIYN